MDGEKNFDLNSFNHTAGNSNAKLIHDAAKKGDIDLLKKLIDSKAD